VTDLWAAQSASVRASCFKVFVDFAHLAAHFIGASRWPRSDLYPYNARSESADFRFIFLDSLARFSNVHRDRLVRWP
jgi:hypothetical protein